MKVQNRWLVSCSVSLLSLLFVTLSAISQSTPAANSSKKVEKGENPLAHTVRHQLQEVPFYSVFDFLSFSIEGDKVTLTGQVQRPTLKANAEAAVKSLEGVASVTNNIEVIPASFSDHELGRNVYRAIYEDAVLQKYAVEPVPPIHIIARNGTVSLEGAVNSDADKSLAGNLAGKVPNLANLRNNLVVRKKEVLSK